MNTKYTFRVLGEGVSAFPRLIPTTLQYAPEVGKEYTVADLGTFKVVSPAVNGVANVERV